MAKLSMSMYASVFKTMFGPPMSDFAGHADDRVAHHAAVSRPGAAMSNKCDVPAAMLR